MNKFTDTPKKTKQKKVVDKPRSGEVIKKGTQTFVKCPKCGWTHPSTETKCRFCGAEL